MIASFQLQQFVVFKKLFHSETVQKLIYGSALARDSSDRRRSPRNHKRVAGIIELLRLPIDEVIYRQGRRDYVLRKAFLDNRESLQKEIEKFETIFFRFLASMKIDSSNLRRKTMGILITPPGTHEQHWHQDAPDTKQYFTLFVALTPSTRANGATEFYFGSNQHEITELAIGDGILLTGKAVHRGTGNSTENDRILFYLVYANSRDVNTSRHVSTKPKIKF
jgi:hypothetical protein